MGLLLFLFIYLLGGISFIPGLIIAGYYSYNYINSVKYDLIKEEEKDNDDFLQEEEYKNLKAGEIEEILKSGVESYMTGWIIVTKEYLQSISAAPNQSINETPEHKSAYSSLYKFVKPHDKNETINNPNPQNQNSVNDAKKLKFANRKHRYFGVLRHGNLFLYKDENQTDVQHVIVLSNHIVAIWPRDLLDGELFTKRSSICIMKKDFRRPSESQPPISSAASLNTQSTTGASSTINLLNDQSESSTALPPKGSFFIYCDMNIEKEDWYFALIRATKKDYKATGVEKDLLEPSLFAKTLHFNTPDIINLIQTLHSSEGQLHTRWINALIGRLFLSLQKTEVFQDFIMAKFSKKLTKINKPGFLDDFIIEKIDVGNSAPFLTYPNLKELSPDGTMLISTNFHYSGNLSFQISTKVNINLGSRFKPREVNLLLSVKFKKIEGRLILKMKAPPSNRIWYGFEKTPKIDLEVEPIVSSSKITYSLVTKTIENKFKEAINDSLVLPNMDDMCFFGTLSEIYRGGIWDKSERPSFDDSTTINIDDADESLLNEIDELSYDLHEKDPQNSDDINTDIDNNSIKSTATEKLDNFSLKSKSSFSKLKLSSSFNGSSSPIKLANKIKRDKSATISVSEDQYLADGSFVPMSSSSSFNDIANVSDGESISSEKKKSISTLKKIGKWYFKDENPNSTSTSNSINNATSKSIYTPPEMIQSRRAPRKASNPTLNKFNSSEEDIKPTKLSTSTLSANQFGSPVAKKFTDIDYENMNNFKSISPPKSVHHRSSSSSLNRKSSGTNFNQYDAPVLPPRGDLDSNGNFRQVNEYAGPDADNSSDSSHRSGSASMRRKNTISGRRPPPLIDFPVMESEKSNAPQSPLPPLPPRGAFVNYHD